MKYRVNGRWYTQDMLLKSAPRDRTSIDLVKQRDRKQEIVDFREEMEAEKVRVAEKEANDARLKALRDKDQLMKVREDAVQKLRDKLAKKKQEDLEIQKLIDEAEAEFQNNNNFKQQMKPIKYFSQPEKDPDWTPETDKPKKKAKQKKKPSSSDEFKRLNKRFQQLVRWVEGEENKSYAGKNEVKLGNYYNAKILEGRTVAQKMKKIKNVFKNKDYFDGFLL